VESIRDVLKQMKNPAFEQQSQALMHRVLHEPAVEALLQGHPELTEHHIRRSINRLYAFAREQKACSQCPGLSFCPNDVHGHTTTIQVESLGNDEVTLQDYKVACERFTSKQQQDAFSKRIKSFYVDKQVLEKGYQLAEMITCDRERATAVDRVHDYVKQASQQKELPGKGLYLYGPLGSGKTYLLSYVLHELAKQGHNGVIVYVPDFVEEAKGWISEPGKLKEMIELLKETDLLVFDDIGAENVSPWIRDHVFATILNYRMNRKPTFFSSNYTLDGLEKHLSFSNREGEEEFKGKRLMERIRHFVEPVEVKGHNKRK